MISYQDILNSIDKSDISVIGYNFKSETIKDELISNFDYVEISEIDSSFCFKSFLRNLKLNRILGNSVKNPDYILLDLTKIKYDIDLDGLGSRQKQTKRILEKLHSQIYEGHQSSFPSSPKLKVLITCPLYKSGTNSEGNPVNSFIGGSGPIYISDFVVSIFDDKITIIKDRIHDNCGKILYKHYEKLTNFVE